MLSTDPSGHFLHLISATFARHMTGPGLQAQREGRREKTERTAEINYWHSQICRRKKMPREGNAESEMRQAMEEARGPSLEHTTGHIAGRGGE